MKNILKKLLLRVMSPVLQTLDDRADTNHRQLQGSLSVLLDKIERNALLSAAPLAERARTMQSINRLADIEFKVFSQWGEDGIIQYLVHHMPIPNKVFVEFGVEDYGEANTRFLLIHDNWEGLVIDANPNLKAHLQKQELYWRYNLSTKISFIDAENINDLISEAGIGGDIGLLSVDIDGNDYWVWKAISVVSPRIVVCEYNSVFGATHRITTPYRPDFVKTKHHSSNLCFGASLSALCELAEEKGYVFVGSNSQGCNAFFVRTDVAAGLPRPTVEAGYVRSKFRSSIDPKGQLTFLAGDARREAIKDAAVVDLTTGRLVKIGDLGEL